MGIELWKIKYDRIYEELSDEEYNFLLRTCAEQDDGNWYIDEDLLKEAIADMKKEEKCKMQNLINTLRTEIKKEEFTGMSFNFG